MLLDALSKQGLERDLLVFSSCGVKDHATGGGVHHEQVDGAAGHVGLEAFHIHVNINGAKSRDRHFLDATDEVVVHMVANLVDGPAHQVVGAKNAELVLDFVVVVTEVP